MYDKSIAKASGRFVLIRGWDDEKKKEPKEAVPPIQIAPAPNSAPPEVQSEEAQKATDRESIIALYGDPSGPTPIEAEDNAPEPFKAMHMAAEIGDEELAFQYARQYVRRMGKLRSRMDLIMGLQAKALEAEGMADGEGWTSADEYKKYDKY
ncbi:MAG: hypothetical protein KDD60_07110, partial [Bdellovibrionales bacterium]|nr:hypothetical protein [Bdellovibrionales bacterium]